MKKSSKKQIKLSEKTFKKQILKFGKWLHPKALPDGVLNITKDFCQKLVDNYKKSPFAPVVRGHPKGDELEKNPTLIVNKNISSLELDKKGLNAVMNLDEKELKKYNDVSASIDMEGEDHKTGKKIGPVLRSIGMVLDPYVKGLEAFIPLHEVESNLLINLSEIQDMTKDKKVKAEKESKEKEAPKAPGTKEGITVETKPEEEKPPVAPVELAETSKLQEKIVELQETVAKQGTQIALKEAEANYNVLLEAGKITPAQKDAYINLCTVSSSIIELSDGTKADVKTLVDSLFEKAPKIIEFKEKGVDAEAAGKEEKLKVELRERRPELTDKEFEKFWDKHGKTAKAYAEDKR